MSCNQLLVHKKMLGDTKDDKCVSGTHHAKEMDAWWYFFDNEEAQKHRQRQDVNAWTLHFLIPAEAVEGSQVMDFLFFGRCG